LEIIKEKLPNTISQKEVREKGFFFVGEDTSEGAETFLREQKIIEEG